MIMDQDCDFVGTSGVARLGLEFDPRGVYGIVEVREAVNVWIAANLEPDFFPVQLIRVTNLER